MKSLRVLFLISFLIFPACATAPRSDLKAIHFHENPELYVRKQKIGERLLPIMDNQNRAEYRVAILDTPEMNAFADGPKFQIVFYKGLLDRLNDEELAYVYAHEVAHIKLGHYGKRIAASVVTSVVFSVAGFFIPGLATWTG